MKFCKVCVVYLNYSTAQAHENLNFASIIEMFTEEIGLSGEILGNAVFERRLYVQMTPPPPWTMKK